MRIFLTLLSSLFFAFSFSVHAQAANSNKHLTKTWQCQQKAVEIDDGIETHAIFNYQLSFKNKGDFTLKGSLEINMNAEELQSLLSADPKLSYDIQAQGSWNINQKTLNLNMEKVNLQATSELAIQFNNLGMDFSEVIELEGEQKLKVLQLDSRNLTLQPTEEPDELIQCLAK